MISQKLGLGLKARRTLFLAGVAGALGAVFRAPLGSALTAVEVLYKKDFESDSLISCILAAVSGYLVYDYFLGGEDVLFLNIYANIHYLEVFSYTFLAILCGLWNIAFVRLHFWVSITFKKLSVPVF